MIPQGSQLVNLAQFANLTSSINAAKSPAELQSLVTEAMTSLAAAQAGINAELATLTPVLALLSPPSIGSIVGWASGLITNVITPMVKPTITYAAQLTEMTAQIAELTSAIQSASTKFPGVTINIPSMPSIPGH
jgi:hypothetical protein